VVKPDGVSFGGSSGEAFLVVKGSTTAAEEEAGTSFAAPLALPP
jgi:hypothetical protein